MQSFRKAAFFVLLLASGGVQASVIDFNSTPVEIAYDQLVFSNIEGSGVDLTILPGSAHLMVQNIPGTSPALLDFTDSGYAIGTTFLFSKDVKGFSVQAGDYGADNDTPLLLKLYDASDNLIDTISSDWPDGASIPGYATLSSDVLGIRKAVFYSGGIYPGSVYLDNVKFNQPVPEPASFLALTVGGLLALRRRKNSR